MAPFQDVRKSFLRPRQSTMMKIPICCSLGRSFSPVGGGLWYLLWAVSVLCPRVANGCVSFSNSGLSPEVTSLGRGKCHTQPPESRQFELEQCLNVKCVLYGSVRMCSKRCLLVGSVQVCCDVPSVSPHQRLGLHLKQPQRMISRWPVEIRESRKAEILRAPGFFRCS